MTRLRSELVAELGLAWVRLREGRVRRRYRGAAGLRVDVADGTLGVDGVVFRYDCRKSLPFPSGAVRSISCGRFFEHVDYTEEAAYFLTECRRVLEPGGVLRLAVTDAAVHARSYCDGRTSMEQFNAAFRSDHARRVLYDYETLQFLLEHCGFSRVERRPAAEVQPDSLTVEAIK